MSATADVLADREGTIRAYYARADAGDDTGALATLTEDAQIRFGNAPPMVGRETLLPVRQQLAAVASALRHDIVRVDVAADGAYATAEIVVVYTRHDCSELAVPGGCAFDFAADGRICGYRVYVDLTELFT